MIKELDDRIELLYKDVMKHPKGNFKILFDDFKQDVGDIMYGENEKQPSMHDRMMDLLNACCRAFGATTMDAMAGGRAELPHPPCYNGLHQAIGRHLRQPSPRLQDTGQDEAILLPRHRQVRVLDVI